MTIYEYIQEQESGFKHPIPLEDGWDWNFKNHIRRSFLYKNSQFERDNEDREQRPFKNVVRPILNIHYRTEGFDVKDIELFVDDPDEYYKSFLLKKFHEKWALQHEMDTFIDELVESYVDYGGVLVKNVRGVRPEVVDLRTLAFCDQTNILSGPFAIKHFMSPNQLRAMTKSGWDEQGIDFLIMKAESMKDVSERDTRTPGKYIELYEVHNISPMDYDHTSGNSETHIQVVGFYRDDRDNKNGVSIFDAPEPNIDKFFKFLKRDPVQGRALGFGAVEELFEPQVWTNFAEIHIAGMLAHASKVFYKSTDPKFKDQNLTNRDNGSVFALQPETDIGQIDNQPRNLTAFTNYVTEMHEHALEMGAASDLFLGQQPTAGTPFKSLETQLVEGKSLHLWRQGRIAVFVDEIYRDWVLPYLAKEIVRGHKFLSELSADEMIEISEAIATKAANKKIKDALISGDLMSREEYEESKLFVKEMFTTGGSRRFIEILKDEFKDKNIGVTTNIAGKQKDMAQITDKMVNVVRQLIATPELRQDPELIKWLNSILESSGMSPIAFSPRRLPVQSEGTGGTDALQDLGEAAKKEKVTT